MECIAVLVVGNLSQRNVAGQGHAQVTGGNRAVTAARASVLGPSSRARPAAVVVKARSIRRHPSPIVGRIAGLREVTRISPVSQDGDLDPDVADDRRAVA
jgi:hypothetical protein